MVLKYLWSVMRHKWFVFLAACELGVPLLGIIHDASKFKSSEMLSYAKYFYGDYIYEKYEDAPPPIKNHAASLISIKSEVDAAFNKAWNDHQKCNKHHWQYWVLINDRSEPQIQAIPMPERYIREMVADWRGAGRAYGNPNTLGWYLGTRDKQIMHPETRKRVEELLGYEEQP